MRGRKKKKIWENLKKREREREKIWVEKWGVLNQLVVEEKEEIKKERNFFI
jgi:uncharacterized membrane protein